MLDTEYSSAVKIIVVIANLIELRTKAKDTNNSATPDKKIKIRSGSETLKKAPLPAIRL